LAELRRKLPEPKLKTSKGLSPSAIGLSLFKKRRPAKNISAPDRGLEADCRDNLAKIPELRIPRSVVFPRKREKARPGKIRTMGDAFLDKIT
jgi:hypothetical protein